jgi:hypothetical protein
MDGWYEIGYKISAWLLFIGSWIYCIVEYGFFLGVALGWIPAAIFALIVAALWPVIAGVLVVGGVIIFLSTL